MLKEKIQFRRLEGKMSIKYLRRSPRSEGEEEGENDEDDPGGKERPVEDERAED